MYSESEFIQLSALQHYLFCPRQCALAYMELSWSENLYTAEGRLLHEKVHDGLFEKRGDIMKARGLWISSARLGLSGQTDVVEFHKTNSPDCSIKLHKYSGMWDPYPVEYKRGKPKIDFSDKVQLCAQALCLEEMLDTKIKAGAIFYGKKKRRQTVEFDHKIRDLTEKAAFDVHELFRSGQTPKAVLDKKCKSCSLIEICLPKLTGSTCSVNRYLKKIIETS